jgi:lipopolysaccharide transport system permease protein
MDDRITVYEADPGRLTFADALRRAAGDVRGAAPLIWRLFARDFTTQFRQRILGYLWIVIAPIVSIAGYWFMAATGFLRPGTIGLPYVLFLYLGTSIWGLMITTMGTISNGILANGDLLMRTSAPPLALALAGLANVIYNIVVNCFVLVLLLLVVRHQPSWMLVFYPLLLLPTMIFATGVGLVLASVGVIARDITSMALAGFGILMFLTPVIYDAKFADPTLAFIVKANPLTYLVAFPRDVTMSGDLSLAFGYGLAILLSLVVLALGTWCFYLVKDRMIERL